MNNRIASSVALLLTFASPVVAEWGFSVGEKPNAFTQTDNSSLELRCDRLRFVPAGYEDSEDIVAKQGLSIRFLKNGSTEVGAFQAGNANAKIQIVDNYPVEIVFQSAEDYSFVLDQIAANASVNLAMIDQDITYGIFDLKGSSAAIKSLRSACAASTQNSLKTEAPEGVVYCGGGGVKRQIEYAILENPDGEWDAIVTVNGETKRAMTAYSYFGNSEAPKEFVVALLGEDRSEFLIFQDGGENWLEFGDYQYSQCN